MAEGGADVWVLTLADNKQAIENELDKIQPKHLHFIYVGYEWLGFMLQHLPLAGNWKHVGWQEAAFKIAKDLHAQIDFDVIHHVSYGSLHIGSRLGRLKRPFIFGPVGGAQTAPAGFSRHFRGGLISECIRTVVARYLYAYVLNARATVREATLVLVANRDTEAVVRTLGANDVRVMTDVGLPAAQIRTEPPIGRSKTEPLRIMWVAQLRPRKGLLLALEALTFVSPYTEWRLTIVGDGRQGRLLPKWLKTLRLEDRVEWRGMIPWADVQAGYDDADLFLFTSLRDTTGVQLLEAMGRGLPILTLDHHGAATLVPDSAGIKVPVSTAKETARHLARAIEKLAADRHSLLAMGEAAIEVARCHTWDKKAYDALKIYRELINERR